MNPRLLISIIFLSLFLISCQKENFTESSGQGDLLTQILIGGEVYQEFAFNAAGLIEEDRSKFHYSKYIYNNAYKLVKSEHYWDERIASSSSYVLEELAKDTTWISPENSEMDVFTSYQYDRFGKLRKTVTNRLRNEVVSTSGYQCNKKGQIVLKIWESSETPQTSEKYHYDKGGNLVKKERFSGEELRTTTEYEFDNRPNPFYSFRKLMIPGRYTNTNNIIKETYTIHFEVDDFLENVQVTEYKYSYNDFGYPVAVNQTTEYVYE